MGWIHLFPQYILRLVFDIDYGIPDETRWGLGNVFLSLRVRITGSAAVLLGFELRECRGCFSRAYYRDELLIRVPGLRLSVRLISFKLQR